MFNPITRVWGYNNNGVTADYVEYDGDLVVLTTNPYNRVGAALESKEYYSQGSFEFVAKTNVPNGACMAFWTYYFKNDDNDPTTPNINHEIDFELYGTNNIIYSSYLKDTTEQTHINSTVNYNINDNEYHTYRFDWYSGERVDFYIDGVLVCTIKDNIPTHQMKVWIGIWCPEWSIQKDEYGNPWPSIIPDKTYTMTVKSFTYIPFN